MTLSEYMYVLAHLPVNRKGSRVAPHKAILLLAVSDLIEQGVITNPLIPIDESLIAAFNRRWKLHVPKGSCFTCRLSYPFYHMSSSEFWSLLPLKSDAREVRIEYSSIAALKKSFVGANIDLDLFEYLKNPDSRAKIRQLLTATYLERNNDSNSIYIAADLLPMIILLFGVA